ncbi:unnamed protein product [Phyllotreta striolata]|uniref:Nuclear receptor domain-containing protein n=1 Tax=Phyllotreta striolata TaxID=444603 RepID=A0A9N9XLX2_PHYSR|nr:unnamed protein product [Phyllotreta striolata]
MDYDAVANNVIMNQLCKVCGEPAAGFHFGAFTCEGCKSFFGRTYNNISSISECKNNGQCVINKKNRTACKACRLRKCLLVGMSKSGSRYGRRSNWFKIHCLLQEQQQQQQLQQQQQQQHQQTGSNVMAAANLLRPHPYLSPLFRHHATPTPTAPTPPPPRHTHRSSSESDSGASSADPDDDLRSNSALSFLKPSASPEDFGARRAPASPASDHSSRRFAPSPPCRLPLAPNWTAAAKSAPAPKWAPDQEGPIDLSVRSRSAASSSSSDSDGETHVDVGVDEPVKSAPLDLTLARQAADVAN